MSNPQLPALRLSDMSEEHQTFIREYVNLGDAQAAARKAGYKKARYGYDLLRLPGIRAGVVSEVQNRMAQGSVIALKTLFHLASSAKSERVRFEAARDLMDRALGKASEGIPQDAAAYRKGEKALLERIGMLVKLLGVQPIIDVTPTEVEVLPLETTSPPAKDTTTT